MQQYFSLPEASEFTISFDWAFDWYDFSKNNDTFISLMKSDESEPFIDITLLDLSSSSSVVGVNYGHFERTYDITSSNLEPYVEFLLTESMGFTGSVAGIDNVSITVTANSTGPAVPTPEPSTILLIGTGLIGIAAYGRKRHSNNKAKNPI